MTTCDERERQRTLRYAESPWGSGVKNRGQLYIYKNLIDIARAYNIIYIYIYINNYTISYLCHINISFTHHMSFTHSSHVIDGSHVIHSSHSFTHPLSTCHSLIQWSHVIHWSHIVQSSHAIHSSHVTHSSHSVAHPLITCHCNLYRVTQLPFKKHWKTWGFLLAFQKPCVFPQENSIFSFGGFKNTHLAKEKTQRFLWWRKIRNRAFTQGFICFLHKYAMVTQWPGLYIYYI